MTSAVIDFSVSESADGGYEARAVGHSIFTCGADWNDLKTMARDAVLCHFDEVDAPRAIRLRLARDDIVEV